MKIGWRLRIAAAQREIVSEGDEITVRIVEVDLPRHRLTLSARNLPPHGKRSS